MEILRNPNLWTDFAPKSTDRQTMLGIVAGMKARSASGKASGKKYKAQIVIFRILLAVNRFSWISHKAKSCCGFWKAVEENRKAVEENQKAVEDFETHFPYATGSMCAHGFGLVKSSTHNLK